MRFIHSARHATDLFGFVEDFGALPGGREQLHEARALSAVVAAMRLHPSDEKLCISGCWAAAALATDCTEAWAADAIALGALDEMCGAMQRHRDVDGLQPPASLVLAAVAAAAPAAAAAHVARAYLPALQSCIGKGHGGAAWKCCQAIASITELPENCRAALATRAALAETRVVAAAAAAAAEGADASDGDAAAGASASEAACVEDVLTALAAALCKCRDPECESPLAVWAALRHIAAVYPAEVKATVGIERSLSSAGSDPSGADGSACEGVDADSGAIAEGSSGNDFAKLLVLALLLRERAGDASMAAAVTEALRLLL